MFLLQNKNFRFLFSMAEFGFLCTAILATERVQLKHEILTDSKENWSGN